MIRAVGIVAGGMITFCLLSLIAGLLVAGAQTPEHTAVPVAPVLGKTVNVAVVHGAVFVKLPAGAGFIPLTEARQIPVRSTLDTTEGVARVTTATATSGKLQSGDFGAGTFTILQNRKQRGLTRLQIVNTQSTRQLCAGIGKNAAASRRLSPRVLGRLNASVHGGPFTSVGEHIAATARGTIWSVANRCAGRSTTTTVTTVHVSSGVVSVRDFVRHKFLTLARRGTFQASGKSAATVRGG